ncbi:hypothetical protein, partial [Legionella nautarum]
MKKKEELDKHPVKKSISPVRSRSRVYYVRGVLGEPQLIQEHFKEIKRLKTGDFSESDLEKLRGVKGVYSFRINKTERLLFSFIQIDGIDYLVILDYLPTHNYHDSPFLRRGFLKHYLESLKELFKELIGQEGETPDSDGEELSFEPCPAAELAPRLATLEFE